jgi:hypothetical protein
VGLAGVGFATVGVIACACWIARATIVGIEFVKLFSTVFISSFVMY